MKTNSKVLLLTKDILNAIVSSGRIDDWNTENYEKLIKYYNDISNKSSIEHYLLGVALFETSSLFLAKEEFDRSIDFDKKNILAYFYRFRCNVLMNKVSRKDEDYQMLIEFLDNSNLELDEIFAISYAMFNENKFRETMKIIERINVEYPFYVNCLLGECVSNIMGKGSENPYFDVALEQLKKPNSSIEWFYKGVIYSEIGDERAAVESYTHSLEINANSVLSYNNRGVSYYVLGEFSKSEKDIKDLLSITEDIKIAFNNYGFIFLKMEKFKESKAMFEKVLKRKKVSFEPFFYYSQLIRHSNIKASEFKDFIEDNTMIFEHTNIDKLDNENDYELRIKLIYMFLKESFIRAMEKEDFIRSHLIKIELLRIHNFMKDYDYSMHTNEKEVSLLKETREIFVKSERAKESFKYFVESTKVSSSRSYLEVLRGWNSFTPIITENTQDSRGGGYFLKLGSKGIVIDPGFNFLQNMIDGGYEFDEITDVVISHAHNDHTADLESILTLLHVRNKSVKYINYVEDLEKQKYIEIEVLKKIIEENDGKTNKIKTEVCLEKCPVIDIVDKNNLQICKKFCPIRDVRNKNSIKEQVDEIFFSENKTWRKKLNLYLNMSTFLKYSGLLKLLEKADYKVIIVEAGEMKILAEDSLTSSTKEIRMEVISAKHNDIISDNSAVGFRFRFDKKYSIIYTGDTGVNDLVKDVYGELGKRIKIDGDYSILIAHLGGFHNSEDNIKYSHDPLKFYYPNHLGRLGLLKINELIQPNICLISEFGEEFRNLRVKISNKFEKVLKGTGVEKIIPADIGLKLFFEDYLNVKGIVDIKYNKPRLGEFNIENIETLEVKNKSVIYFDKSNVTVKRLREII